MIEPMNQQRVVVQREQDPEPWEGNCFYEVFQEIPIGEGRAKRGVSFGICVVDDRGFEMFAQKHQMRDAQAA